MRLDFLVYYASIFFPFCNMGYSRIMGLKYLFNWLGFGFFLSFY